MEILCALYTTSAAGDRLEQTNSRLSKGKSCLDKAPLPAYAPQRSEAHLLCAQKWLAPTIVWRT